MESIFLFGLVLIELMMVERWGLDFFDFWVSFVRFCCNFFRLDLNLVFFLLVIRFFWLFVIMSSEFNFLLIVIKYLFINLWWVLMFIRIVDNDFWLSWVDGLFGLGLVNFVIEFCNLLNWFCKWVNLLVISWNGWMKLLFNVIGRLGGKERVLVR